MTILFDAGHAVGYSAGKHKESASDSFGARHSSTSILAAQDMSVEAMNSASYLRSRMIVILNDNGQVSLPTGTSSAGGVVPASQLSTYTQVN